MAFLIAPPEYGKTTVARRLVRRHLEQHERGLVFVHDPVAQYHAEGCQFYPDVNAWRAAAAAASAEGAPPMPRGSSLGGSAEDVTKLALELGERCGNTQDDVRVPILVVWDEASLLDGSGSTWVGKSDAEFLATRRHRGVGGIFNLQDTGQLMQRFYRASTDVYLFAQPAESVALLEKHLMLDKGTLRAATKLEMYDYLHVRLRVGVVPEEL